MSTVITFPAYREASNYKKLLQARKNLRLVLWHLNQSKERWTSSKVYCLTMKMLKIAIYLYVMIRGSTACRLRGMGVSGRVLLEHENATDSKLLEYFDARMQNM